MVYALITLYNPDLNVYRNIIQISKQVDHVYLCDNSSERNGWNFESNNITYLYNKGENLGISLAYNKILTNEAKYSFRMEDYILFFDQDTYIPNDHVSKLVCEYENICQNRKVGCLGPVFINEVTGQKELPRIKKYINDNTFLTKSVITSSMLTKYKVLKEIDFFNRNLFLDFVDFDLCWRMMQKGYICCMSDVSIMCHSVGIAQIQLLGDKIYIESPIRDYYQTKGSLYLLRQSYVPLKFKIKFIYRLISRPIVYRFKFKDYKERYQYIKKGYIDWKKNI